MISGVRVRPHEHAAMMTKSMSMLNAEICSSPIGIDISRILECKRCDTSDSQKRIVLQHF